MKRTYALIAILVMLLVPTSALAAGDSGSVGTTSINGPVPGGAGGGGSSGGSIYYYELLNTDKNDTLELSATQREKLAKIRETAGPNGNQTKAAEKATNVLVDKCTGNKYYQDDGCILWDEEYHTTSSSNNKVWGEIHTFDPEAKEIAVEKSLTAYNMKVWRENPPKDQFDLIFERRVGVGEGDSDPPPNNNFYGPDIQRRWWYGSKTESFNGSDSNKGGSFSLDDRTSAGPFGQMTGADKRNCRSNYQDGNNGQRTVDGKKVGKRIKVPGGGWNWCYWEGDDIGNNYFKWAKNKTNDPSGVYFYQNDLGRAPGTDVGGNYDDQFGAQKGDDQGALGKGLKEAIFVKWKGLAQPGTGQFSYRIEGAPGLYYIVQIVALDHRENILGSNSNTKGASTAHGQYVKAYLANPIKDDQNNSCKPVSDCNAGTDAPAAAPSLDAETPLQTREQSAQGVSMEVDQLSAQQALFPYTVTLAHFTPQLNYSAVQLAGNKTYDSQYVSYEDQANGVRVPAQGIASPPGSSLDVQQVNLRGAAWTDPSEDSGDILTEDPLQQQPFTFDMTWLKPTLNSPCYTGANPDYPQSNQQSAWPKSLRICSKNSSHSDSASGGQFVNAWDDMLRAQLTWEARWVDGVYDQTKNANAPGPINGLLRCADNEGEKWADDCNNGYFGLVSNAINSSQQWAQGMINLSPDDGEATAPARIVLDTNRPDRITGVNVQERGGSFTSNPSASIYPAAGRAELNYCDQGLPDGTNVIKSTGGVRAVNNSELGDVNCQGYAVKWQWDNGSCQSQPTNQATFGDQLPVPALLSESDQQKVALYGNYHDSNLYTVPHRAAYQQSSFTGIPFEGGFPGSADNSGYCGEVNVAGHYKNGRWDRTYDFKHLNNVNANCVFTSAQIETFNKSQSNGGERPPGAPSGTAEKCNGPGGNGKWSFGYWYPVTATWAWETDSCTTTTKEQTELWDKKNNGHYTSSTDPIPPKTGTLGLNKNTLITLAGASIENDDPYFKPGKWNCTYKQKQYKNAGQWKISRDAQNGWGERNTAGALAASKPATNYVFSFEFTTPTQSELINSDAGNTVDKTPDKAGTCPPFRNDGKPGTCWQMRGQYVGPSNWKWKTQNATSGYYQDTNSAYVKVYSPRNDR